MAEIDVDIALGRKPKMRKRTIEKFGRRALALVLLSLEMADDFTGLTSLRGKKGLWYFARKMDLGLYSISRVMKELEEEGFLVRKDDEFFITPRGKQRARKLKIYAPVKMPEKWDGKWYFAIFDIPEDKRDRRDILRSVLKRKGFIRLQNSVFVAPYADFGELNLIRHELSIEKYVNFLVAESAETDDDSLLRKKFNLRKKPE